MIEKDQTVLKFQDMNGNTLLHLAAKEGNAELTKILLNKNIDVEKTNLFDFTAF